MKGSTRLVDSLVWYGLVVFGRAITRSQRIYKFDYFYKYVCVLVCMCVCYVYLCLSKIEQFEIQSVALTESSKL